MGGPSTLTALGQGVFNWLGSGVTSTVAFSPKVTTHYTVVLFGTNGCINTLNSALAVLICDGLQELSKEPFSAYIDISNQLHLASALPNQDIREVHLYDLQGRLLLRSEPIGGWKRVDLSNFSHGWYVIEVEGTGEGAGEKTIVLNGLRNEFYKKVL